jgi:hypothetical protein
MCGGVLEAADFCFVFFFFLSLAPCIVLVIVGLEDFLEENPVRVSARVR